MLLLLLLLLFLHAIWSLTQPPLELLTKYPAKSHWQINNQLISLPCLITICAIKWMCLYVCVCITYTIYNWNIPDHYTQLSCLCLIHMFTIITKFIKLMKPVKGNLLLLHVPSKLFELIEKNLHGDLYRIYWTITRYFSYKVEAVAKLKQ